MPTQPSQPNTQSQPQTYTVDSFANLIKTKYPAYKNIDNNTLVQKFIAKYPVYKSRVNMAQPVSSIVQPKSGNPISSLFGAAKSAAGGAASAVGGYVKNIAGDYSQAGQDISKDISDVNKNANPLTIAQGGLRVAGSVAGASFAPITEAIKGLSDTVSNSKEVQKFAQNPAVSKILDFFGNTSGKLSSWATKHPDAAQDLGAVMNIGMLAVGDEVAPDSINPDIADTAGKIKGAIKDSSLKQTTEDVSPRLTAEEAESTKTKTSTFTKKITKVPSKNTIDMANAVHDTIKSGKTFSEKANLADEGISKEAKSLKSQIKDVDHPVPKKELISSLKKTEKPVLISSDRTLNTAYNLVIRKATDIIDKMDGTVSGTLDGRKSFDDFVSKQFPNLYESDTMTPMRTAIKNIRNQWNDFTESQLPDNVKFKNSLDKQSKLFEARDILREKAARGAPKVQGEIGTNRFGRWAKAHPKTVKLAKTGAGIAATSLGVGEVVKH